MSFVHVLVQDVDVCASNRKVYYVSTISDKFKSVCCFALCSSKGCVFTTNSSGCFSTGVANCKLMVLYNCVCSSLSVPMQVQCTCATDFPTLQTYLACKQLSMCKQLRTTDTNEMSVQRINIHFTYVHGNVGL